jgi:hypothetical protein
MTTDSSHEPISASEATSLPDNFSRNVVNSIFDVFIVPELARRNMALGRDDIRKVVVELDPDRRHPRVSINENAKIVAHISATREIAAGEQVTESDINEVFAVMPAEVGPNSGYVVFAIINGNQHIVFDFRYNKERVADLIARAREFLGVAYQCAADAPAVACDLAFSAAELSVQAQMLLMQQRTKSHSDRQDWLDSWADHSNSPLEHSAALRDLHQYRASGRYAEVPFIVDAQHLENLLAIVKDMIGLAAERSKERQLVSKDPGEIHDTKSVGLSKRL